MEDHVKMESGFDQVATEKLFHSKRTRQPGLASQRQYYESKNSWNRFIGIDFASKRPTGDVPASVETGRSVVPARPGTKKTSAVARLYELKMQRMNMQRSLNIGQEQAEQSDVASVSNMSTGTYSRAPSILSDASTKMLDGPLAPSAWKPFRPSKGLVGKRAKGVGLLHVDGDAADSPPLRETYSEQRPKPLVDRDDNKEMCSVSNAKELRRQMKSQMHLFAHLDVVHGTLHVALPSSKRLSVVEREKAFERLCMLENEANTKIADIEKEETVQVSMRGPCRLRPEVMERLERIKMLSEHAEKLYTVEYCSKFSIYS